MHLQLINNYKFKAVWSNIFHCVYREDALGIRHFLLGIFGLFIFIAWDGQRIPFARMVGRAKPKKSG